MSSALKKWTRLANVTQFQQQFRRNCWLSWAISRLACGLSLKPHLRFDLEFVSRTACTGTAHVFSNEDSRRIIYTLLNLLFEFGLERTGVKHVPERKFIANKLFGFRDNWNSGKFISLQSCIRSKTCSYESTTVDFGVLLSLAPVLHHTSKFEMFRNHNL